MRGRRWVYLAGLVLGIPVAYIVLLNLGI